MALFHVIGSMPDAALMLDVSIGKSVISTNNPSTSADERVNRGFIGEGAFRSLLRHPILRSKTFILETPLFLPHATTNSILSLELSRSAEDVIYMLRMSSLSDEEWRIQCDDLKSERKRVFENLEKRIRRRVPDSLRDQMERNDQIQQSLGRWRAKVLKDKGVIWGFEGFLESAKRKSSPREHQFQTSSSRTATPTKLLINCERTTGRSDIDVENQLLLDTGTGIESDEETVFELDDMAESDNCDTWDRCSKTRGDIDGVSDMTDGLSTRRSPRKLGVLPEFSGVPDNTRR